ncbi:MAG: neutral/alkaline non-lysosomal ceramidase N-terminal domain-containing protein, partial [Planctomycetota bacterium]
MTNRRTINDSSRTRPEASTTTDDLDGKMPRRERLLGKLPLGKLLGKLPLGTQRLGKSPVRNLLVGTLIAGSLLLATLFTQWTTVSRLLPRAPQASATPGLDTGTLERSSSERRSPARLAVTRRPSNAVGELVANQPTQAATPTTLSQRPVPDVRTTMIPIGAAKLDVTPQHPVRLTGYGNRKTETASVAQPLWVKALAIGADRPKQADRSEDGPAVLLTLENCGLTPPMRKAVVDALSEQAGIRDERIVIAVSHTHTGPALRDWAPFLFSEDIPADHQRHIDQYTDEVVRRLVQVAKDALAARRPGRLAWGQGQVGFAANRRRLEGGKWAGFGVQADGPVDPSLPVLAARDSKGGLIAVVANYACHCTTLSGDFNQIAGDWAGYAQEMIESDHPGAIALITIGCGADANPEPRGRGLELCKRHGRSFADEVKRLLAGPLTPVDPRLTCQLRYIDLPYETALTRGEWQERSKEPGASGYHARQCLAKLDRGETLPTSITYPIALWTFGE